MHNVSIFVGGAILLFALMVIVTRYKVILHNIKWCLLPFPNFLRAVGILILEAIVAFILAVIFILGSICLSNFFIWAYHLFIQ